MKILTWNIQAAKGCDGRFDTARIVSHIKRYDGLDVICLQEVSNRLPELNSDDQPLLIGSQFPDFESVWAPGFSVPDAAGFRCEFGNLTLVKQALLRDARVHVLPGPPVAELQIPRTMAEIVVGVGDMNLAIFNAHLAFHSSPERVAQLQALTRLRDQILAKSQIAKVPGATGPFCYANTIDAVILSGDLNTSSDSDEFKTHVSDQNWVDAWTAQTDGCPDMQLTRQPTCGCFDHTQWPEGPHVRDYFLTTQNIAGKIERVEVDADTDASDHQPVLLEIAL